MSDLSKKLVAEQRGGIMAGPGRAVGRRPWLRLGASLLVLAGSHVLASTAYAQSVEASDQGQDGDAGSDAQERDIVVTASRTERSGFEAPTPVTVLGARLLERSAATNFADQLNRLPSLRPTSTPSTATFNSSNAGSNFLNLRGLGTARTLVLVNNRRHVGSNPEGRVDLNVIPSSLISRLEIVTGGASAAWGSDAVAGVVNVILDNRFEGVKGSAQAGITDEGDNAEHRVTLAAGSSFAGGRGHVIVGMEYADSDGVRDPDSRGWFRQHHAQVGNPARTSTNGLPQILILPDVTASNASAGGLINAGPLRGIEFLPGGGTRQFRYGSIVGPSLMSGGDGVYPAALGALTTPLQRFNVFGRASYELADSVTAFAEAGYARSRSKFELTFFTANDTNIVIQRDNAYLPESVRSQMVANGLTSFTMGRYSDDIRYQEVTNGNDVYRVAGGLEGKIAGGWKWSAYGSYGKTNSIGLIDRNRINRNYTMAVDAVRDPATGNIVCRSTLTSPTNNCVPINLFGVGSPSEAAASYFLGRRDLVRKMSLTAFGADINGEPFSTWAGPVSLAAGLEYRRDTVNQIVNKEAIDGLFNIGNTKPFRGVSSVKEGYLETVVPLAADLPMLHRLEFNGAVRLTDYQLSGTVTTWKAGASWEPARGLRIRATRSRDIRAPNLAELFTGLSLSFTTIFDPVTNRQEANVQAPTVGNPALLPETADTTTLGVVLSPAFAPGLRFSVDAYDIDLQGVISSLGAQNIVTFCSQGATEFCNAITRGADGRLQQVVNTPFNLASTKTRGADFELAYELPIVSDGSRVGIRLLASYVDRFVTNNGTSVQKLGRVVGEAGPRWRGNASVSYDKAGFSSYFEALYVGKGIQNPSTTYDNPDIKAWMMFNLGVSYDLGHSTGRQTELFLKVDNMFDKAPPVAPTSFLPTNYGVYDLIGRRFSAGARFRF